MLFFGFFYRPDKPFAEWETEYVCNWLEDIGLENYAADLRRWIKNGAQLLAASPHDLEKELGMKNPLHKKKILLALQEMSDKGPGGDELLKPAGCLDTHWVSIKIYLKIISFRLYFIAYCHTVTLQTENDTSALLCCFFELKKTISPSKDHFMKPMRH